MKIQQEIKKLAEQYLWGKIFLSKKDKYQTEIAYMSGYKQCQQDMYEFGKLVLDTFHSEGKTHSGKDRLARVKFDEWFKQLNKQD